MPDPMTFDLQLGTAPPGRPTPREAGDPLRILVLGAFGTGAAADALPAPVGLDIDNFDTVMRRLAPRLQLSLAPDQAALSLRFNSLEDFHPDALYRRLDVFAELRALRARLSDPHTFEAAAAEFRPAQQSSAAQTEAAAEEDSAMLSRLLGARPAAAPTGHAGLAGFIKNLVAPYISPDNSARLSAYLDAVDQAGTTLMRGLLHHPDFQSLESSWRALRDLIARCDDSIQIHLIDIDKAGLGNDLLHDPVESSKLYRRLIAQGADIPGTPPWSLLLGNYTFGAEPDDIPLLAALARLAAHCGAPFVAAADPMITGETPSPDLARQAQWQRLRRSALAPWLGLALPRVLLRLPYGTGTDPIESFAFEELDAQRRHGDYLWGNPTFAIARLLCAGFQEDGWEMQPDAHRALDDLPAHIYTADGARDMQACAEVYLSEHDGEELAAQGFMTLLSMKGHPEARLLRFQSIADPAVGLMGAWN